MPRVRIIADPFDLAAYSEHTTNDVLGLLADHFPVWPTTARLYLGEVSVTTDVTPRSEQELAEVTGAGDDALFYVVVYPGDPITAIIAVVAVLALATAVLAFLTPRVPTPNTDQPSGNNSLGDRQNQARLSQRIEDIFGEVISIPSLLAVPLRLFINNVEVEQCFMCVGRGAYDILDVKDGDTPLGLIAGSGAAFYGPNTSPNNSAPYYTVGVQGDQTLRDIVKLNEVNGQTLRAPNQNSVNGNSDIRFVAPDVIQRSGNGTTGDFTQYFGVGDEIVVTGAEFSGGMAKAQNLLSAKFYPDMTVLFDDSSAAQTFPLGVRIDLTNAVFSYTATNGTVVTADLSGTYYSGGVNSSGRLILLAAPPAGS